MNVPEYSRNIAEAKYLINYLTPERILRSLKPEYIEEAEQSGEHVCQREFDALKSNQVIRQGSQAFLTVNYQQLNQWLDKYLTEGALEATLRALRQYRWRQKNKQPPKIKSSLIKQAQKIGEQENSNANQIIEKALRLYENQKFNHKNNQLVRDISVQMGIDEDQATEMAIFQLARRLGLND